MSQNNPLPKIKAENPFQQERKNIEQTEAKAPLFYSLLSGNDDLENLTQIQIEVINEIKNICNEELLKFENNIEKNPSIKKRAEVLFATKERYYQKIIQKFSKYLSLECAGEVKNLPNLNLKKLRNIINLGFKEVISVMENDLPLYDKLFSEMDSIRESNQKVELYIGRDGIYAYEGRRAMDIANRRKRTKEEKAQRKMLEIHPKYINYNSYIQKNYDEETRIKYLQDQGVNSGLDLIVYDTGYRGSIPEQILRSMGYSKEEIEKRIKILGTDFYINPENSYEENIEEKIKIRNRVVKGIPYSLENYNKVARIEERPKRVMTSAGLYVNNEGKLTPIEAPYLNELSFHYDLIELTIRQYYFNREYFQKNI